MSLDSSDVENIAWLARLSPDRDTLEAGRGEMNRILELVEQMNSVDTGGVEPLSHPVATRARMRPDVVTEENQREEFQRIAPETENGHYLVPRVIE